MGEFHVANKKQLQTLEKQMAKGFDMSADD